MIISYISGCYHMTMFDDQLDLHGFFLAFSRRDMKKILKKHLEQLDTIVVYNVRLSTGAAGGKKVHDIIAVGKKYLGISRRVSIEYILRETLGSDDVSRGSIEDLYHLTIETN